MGPMTQAEYAKHRGVTRQAIWKLVNAGRIRLRPDGKIDPADADFALGRTQQRAVAREEPAPEAPAYRPPPAETGLTRARTADAMYEARIKQLRYEQLRGNLVETAAVVEAAVTCSEIMLRSLGRMAAHAEQFVGKDVAGARAVLRSIERELRDAVSAAFTKLAADAKSAAAQASDDDSETAQ